MTKTEWHDKCMYRVSIKAVIKDSQGNVLVVQEKGHKARSLPGGGIDYGETEYEGLKRELLEEVGYDGEFDREIIGIEMMYLENKQAWQMWVVYRVVPENYDFSVGVDADIVEFVNPEELRDEHPLSYKYATM